MKVALIYDFDGTLAEGNCAEHGLMPAMGINSSNDIKEFWKAVRKENEERDADEILTYLGFLAMRARIEKQRDQLTKEKLKLHGEKIPLFKGVDKWFPQINEYASSKGVELEHYIVSSGLEHMIEGSSIGDEFKKIFGCRYHYDKKTGYVKWIEVAVNYTTKTQYLFRINKGISNTFDNNEVNRYIEEQDREIPFENMIYLGDGDTDIPCMRLVKDKGGCSIAVYDQKNFEECDQDLGKCDQDKIEKLISEDRVNFVAPNDYRGVSFIY